MPNPTPLNPDALKAATRAVSLAEREMHTNESMGKQRNMAYRAVEAYLDVAQPVVNSVEELDALPVGTVVIINGTMLQADDRDVYGTMWSRVRDIDAYPSESLALPARVLYRPEVKP